MDYEQNVHRKEKENMDMPQVIEYKEIRVMTTKQIAEAYGTTELKINHNFGYQKERYKEGKHYIVLKGEELRQFKNCCRNSSVVGKRTGVLYLWTEKGALLHAKSLNTDKAWEVYDYLVDFYFRAKEKEPVAAVEPAPKDLYVDVPDNVRIREQIRKLQDDLTCMHVILDSLCTYITEDSYNTRMKTTHDMVGKIIQDSVVLRDMKPNLVVKKY